MMEKEIESAKNIYDVLNAEIDSQKKRYEDNITSKNERMFLLEDENKSLSQQNVELKKKNDAFYKAMQGVNNE